jgi:endoglucanase
MRKKCLLFVLIHLLACVFANAQSVAQRRADCLGLGMNLSYLDNWWLGNREKRFSDFAKAFDAAKREKMFADISEAGFKTVRIPITFGSWASIDRPYKWEKPDALKMSDLFIQWALANDLNVIIDLHHVEFDGSIPGAATTERIVWLWKEIAGRYKNTDPEKVFFEIRNEPHDIQAEDWRAQANEIIRTVRAITPDHTLIVGFHDWNSRQAMIDSRPFSDGNIIYTFHYYDPFVFTHQGATWSAKGLPELTFVPFPAKEAEIKVPETARGTWVESQIKSYRRDSRAEKMFADLKAAKDWSLKNDVPIFLGEFGSFGKYPSMADRCRHAEAVYSALGKLNIPNAWWEWDGGFSMFEKGTTRVSNCMRKAIDSYVLQRSVK